MQLDFINQREKSLYQLVGKSSGIMQIWFESTFMIFWLSQSVLTFLFFFFRTKCTSFAYDSAAFKITSNHGDDLLQILIRKQEQKSVF